MRNGIVAGILLFVTVPVFGDQAPPNPQSNARLGALRKAEQANPYGRLFQVPQALKQAVAVKANAAKPTVVCGMLIVPVDPSLDPKMRITPPQDPNVAYKIRTFDPPVCNPSK